MIGIELVKDKQSRTPVGPMRDKIVDLAFERGLLILGCGETTIRLCPPLIVNEHEAEHRPRHPRRVHHARRTVICSQTKRASTL